MAGMIQQVYLSPEPWSGTIKDMTWTGYISVWCFENPTVPWTVKCGTSTITIPQTLNCNNAEGTFDIDVIDSVGRYILPGNCWVELTGGTGGNIHISGGV